MAPAGAGKTTLLARFAARASGPVGWYRAEPWDRDEPALYVVSPGQGSPPVFVDIPFPGSDTLVIRR